MLDAFYSALNRGIEILFESQRVRRTVMLVCFSLPFGILLLEPSWVREGYLLTAPLLFLGCGLLMLDMHLWQDRRDAGKARRAEEAQAE